MLDAQSPRILHILQNVALVYLSLVFLPMNAVLLKIVQYWNVGRRPAELKHRDAVLADPTFTPRTILVTGVSMTKGLALSRLFFQAGHRVIAADYEPSSVPLTSGRVSLSVTKFCRLAKPTSAEGSAPYIKSLLDIVENERVELWVSCSGVASAVADGEAKQVMEAKTNCKAVQYDVAMTQTLHEKHSFITYTKELGLNVPDTHTVTSMSFVQSVLSDAPQGRMYIMKPNGMDDANRGDMTLLPKSTPEATKAHLTKLNINEKSPWILQQFISGREFCTHALVIQGSVRAFVACPSAELLMHYEALPSTSSLSKAMLQFTKTFAGQSGRNFTGHLSFDFLVEPEHLHTSKPAEVVLWPIECNPRAHTAVVLFKDTLEMTEAYLSLLTPYKPALINGLPQPKQESKQDFSLDNDIIVQDSVINHKIITPRYSTRYAYYWLPHDIVTSLILPTYHFMTLQSSLTDLLNHLKDFIEHILLWHDGTFVLWDPTPAWWLWHIQWPSMFVLSLGALLSSSSSSSLSLSPMSLSLFNPRDKNRQRQRNTNGMWSRINLSTGKMFGC